MKDERNELGKLLTDFVAVHYKNGAFLSSYTAYCKNGNKLMYEKATYFSPIIMFNKNYEDGCLYTT